jgi:hypothetical protein
MNEDAGCGSLLFVTLRLESGEELPFMVDTGSPVTVFDKSLESKLGKRLATAATLNFGDKHESALYATPRLYLGNTLLMTGGNSITFDFRQMSSNAGRPIMGALGMDCLRHYCIQLDFEAGKMRFLDPDDVNAATLGKAFPLTFSSEGQGKRKFVRLFLHHSGLIGGKDTNVVIDTGCNIDGGINPRLFQREVQAQKGVLTDGGYAQFPGCVWNGETYTNITIRTWPIHVQGPNLIGLRFLARHLVTLDFPKRTIYLKQTSCGPLADERAEAAMQFLKNLKEQGQLPGWSKGDHGAAKGATINSPSNSITVEVLKNGDPSSYHYEVTRASKDSPWTLKKAWQTDQNDKTVEEYPVPCVN